MTELKTAEYGAPQALEQLRAAHPLVQCITNSVVTNYTANALLAMGATPAMVDIPEEAGAFAAVADGVLVNLGTPTAEQRAAALEIPTVTRRWVLDPVAVGSLSVRTALAHELLDATPAIVRGNPSEIMALAGAGGGGRGVDATADSDAAVDAAIVVARRAGTVVAVSGAVDVITDGRRVLRIRGGDPMLTLVTGGGCTLGASMAAFLGVCSPIHAAVAASVLHKVAAETATTSAGPASFATRFLDALYTVRPDGLTEAGRVAESSAVGTGE